MLKKTLFISCVGILLASQNAMAGEAAQNGAWGGVAGGVLIGQAIGRNTKSTLLGGAIGGVLGYMVGNEREKEQIQPLHTYLPNRVVRQYEEINIPDCREVEMLATVDDRPERVYGTVCYENGAWVLQENGRMVNQTVIINRDYPTVRVHYQQRGNRHWREARHHPGYYGHSAWDRRPDNRLIIFR